MSVGIVKSKKVVCGINGIKNVAKKYSKLNQNIAHSCKKCTSLKLGIQNGEL